MDQIFLKVINMSITASYVILFLILIRLFIRKLPKIYSYILWIIVLIRLLVPFSFSSLFSMIPDNGEVIPRDIIYAAKPEIYSGIAGVDKLVNSSLPKAVDDASINPIQIWIFLGKIIWLAGILILLIYSIISTLKLLKALSSSKHLRYNIYTTDFTETPFVFGVLRPKIYIPSSLSKGEQSYIIKHEETHIERYDHIIKFAFHIAKIIHWFNPLVWLGFSLMSKDMELSCDEKVIKEMGNEIKKDYSHSLLSISSDKKIIGNSPLAFGGGNTKGRIKNILDYKKPRFWASMLGIIVIIVSVIGLLTNPKPRGITVEEEMLVKEFIENYYGQLAYTKEEQEIVKEEIDEIIEHGKVTREEGFYYYYQQVLAPELYQGMVSNRWLPNLDMVEMGYDEIKVSNMELSKDKEVIHASFDLECYIWGESIEEERISLDFKLREIKNKLHIESIDGDLYYKPSVEIDGIKEDINYNRISKYMKERSIDTFSPYYELLEFNISNYNEEIIDGLIHATFHYQIIEKNYDKDPDTVGYIKEAKESGSSYYQQMYDEYLEPREMNFDLKIIIDENDTMQLYSNISPNGIEWEETKMDDFILSQP